MTPLLEAAHRDDTALAKRLLESGAEPSVENRCGITPLYLACLNGNGDLVSALLKAGADPFSSSSARVTAPSFLPSARVMPRSCAFF